MRRAMRRLPSPLNAVTENKGDIPKRWHQDRIVSAGVRYGTCTCTVQAYVIRVRSSSRAAPGKGARPLPGSAATDLR